MRPAGIAFYGVWIGLWILDHFRKPPTVFKALRDLSPSSPHEWLRAFWMDFGGIVLMCVFLGYLLLPSIRKLFVQQRTPKSSTAFHITLAVLIIATGVVLAILRFAYGYRPVF